MVLLQAKKTLLRFYLGKAWMSWSKDILFLGAQATLGASNSLILQDYEDYEGEEEEKLPFLNTKSHFEGNFWSDSFGFKFF